MTTETELDTSISNLAVSEILATPALAPANESSTKSRSTVSVQPVLE